MKIAFDHQIFTLQSYGGISRYFVRLAEELILKNADVRVFAPLHCNRYLKDIQPDIIFGREVVGLPAKAVRLASAANRYLSERAMFDFKPTIVHETYYTRRPVSAYGASRILTVYDMIHELFPTASPCRDNTTIYKRAAVERADHIICISHSTKADLCNIFDVPESKVSVAHLGFQSFANQQNEHCDQKSIRPFLLFVGNRGGYKNFASMLRAVASCRDLSANFDIVAFGGGGFNRSETQLMHELGYATNAVRHLQGGDALLGSLYRKAAALVYPSQYEGFGLPPLEAMANNCPVVSSNTSSMPEVISQAGEFFSPNDIEEQAQAIRNVVFSAARQTELIKLGNERLKFFSWAECAEKTLAVYEEFEKP